MAFVRLVKAYQKILAAGFGILFIIVGTLAALRWAKGDRFNFGDKGPELTGTGLLVASSDPKGAQVYLNGKLTTATDDTLNLPPGSYEVEIKKDGFLPWKKKLQLTAELVTQTTAKLFPSVPNLTPLTFTGAGDPLPSPDGQKIVYRVTEADNEAKNGLWILELAERNFAVARASEPKQIARTTSQYDFSISKLVWTPDSSQLLAYWQEADSKVPKSLKELKKFKLLKATLLNTGGMNDEADFKDAGPRLPVMLSQWYQDLDQKDKIRIKELPEFMQEVVQGTEGSEGREGRPAARAAYFSPDEKRLLYSPTEDLTIPEKLIPDLPAESTQAEERDIKVGSLYVYDIEEDRNYKIEDGLGYGSGKSETGKSDGKSSIQAQAQLPGDDYWQRRLADDRVRWEEATASGDSRKPPRQTALPPVPEELMIDFLADLPNRYSPIWQLAVQWFPTSAHLLAAADGISITEYDGTNNSVVYSGPSQGDFVYPWPNGSRLAILTNFNDQNSPTNLYAINLK